MSDVVELKPALQSSIAGRFIAKISDKTRKEEAKGLLEMMSNITELEAKMWGPSIVGFGRFRYKTPSGRESEFAMIGLQPREKDIAIYLDPNFEDLEPVLAKLGKYTVGKACIYIREFKRVDMKALEELLVQSFEKTKTKYKSWKPE